MENIYSVIKAPWVTEKSNNIMMGSNCFTFKVLKAANKNQIKSAIEKIFNVTVEKVKVMTVKGKTRRIGKSVGKRPDWKKAIVTLKEGDSIEMTEGV